MQVDRQRPNCFLEHVAIQFPSTMTEVPLVFFSPDYVLEIFVKYPMAEVTCTHVWLFDFVPFVYISALCQYHVVLITKAL